MVELAELVDELEERYGEYAEIAVGVVVVEVTRPDEDDVEQQLSTVHYARAAGGASETIGALMRAQVLLAAPELTQDGDDDDEPE